MSSYACITSPKEERSKSHASCRCFAAAPNIPSLPCEEITLKSSTTPLHRQLRRHAGVCKGKKSSNPDPMRIKEEEIIRSAALANAGRSTTPSPLPPIATNERRRVTRCRLPPRERGRMGVGDGGWLAAVAAALRIGRTFFWSCSSRASRRLAWPSRVAAAMSEFS